MTKENQTAVIPLNESGEGDLEDMRIINLVDRLDRVNLGIWSAAIASAAELKSQFGVSSEIWFPKETNEAEPEELRGALGRGLPSLNRETLKTACKEARLNIDRDIIVSHGCWQFPTRWGRALKNMGLSWIAVPQGMLEPWSVSQKRLRKWLYYKLFEKPALAQADIIRAVGKPEFNSLQKTFAKKVVWIPNGVDGRDDDTVARKDNQQKTVLFMARLHHKKGVLPLLEGWKASRLCGNSSWILKIAGPDDGELGAVENYLNANRALTNVEYLGPIYGKEKETVLSESHFYILPSFSEGFPTSILEAMVHGMIPMISRGCNFPEVLDEALGIEVEPDVDSIRVELDLIHGMTLAEYLDRANMASNYVRKYYTNDRLAKLQMDLFRKIASKPGK